MCFDNKKLTILETNMATNPSKQKDELKNPKKQHEKE